MKIIDDHLEKKDFGKKEKVYNMSFTCVNKKSLKDLSEKSIRFIRESIEKDWDMDIPETKEVEQLDKYLKEKKEIEKEYFEWSEHYFLPVLVKYCLENSTEYVEEYAKKVADVYFSSAWVNLINIPPFSRYRVSVVTDEETEEVYEMPIFV